MKNRSGFTLVEIVVVAGIVGIIALAIAQLVMPMGKFFQRGRVRQGAMLEARACLETIQRVLSNGRASTLVISNSPTSPTMQSGQVQFQGVDGSSYTIIWSTTPANTVHLERTPPNSAVTNDTVLATHITLLAFTIADLADPEIVDVSLRMTVPLDNSGTPDSFLTVYLPSQKLRMTGT